jgi:hypothetical protein
VHLQAPRRRSDGAAVVDTERYQVKLYTTPGGEKLIKRRGGTVEKQYRLNIGRLPVAYRHAALPLADLPWFLDHAHPPPMLCRCPSEGPSVTTTCKAQMLQSNRGTAQTLSAAQPDSSVPYLRQLHLLIPRSEPEGRFLYVLDNAVTTYGVGRDATGGGRPPTPPCITAVDSMTTQIALEVDDHADKASILKVRFGQHGCPLLHSSRCPGC